MSSAASAPIATYREFWPHYLREHAKGSARLLHFFGTTLAIALSRTRGREAGTETMAGTIRGLPSYFAFAIVLALLVEHMGLVATCVLALVASGVAATASWRLGASARRGPR